MLLTKPKISRVSISKTQNSSAKIKKKRKQVVKKNDRNSKITNNKEMVLQTALST